MKSQYDILIIGGGPAGAIAAKTAKEKGLEVGLVEKRPAIGAPVRCAEGIGKKLLADFIRPDERWIAAEIERATIIAPDGTTMELAHEMAGSEVGYILDRKVFDRELIWQAADAGAEIFVKTRAIAPILEEGKVIGAKIEAGGDVTEVKADVVIAADGVESKFGKWCGIDTTVPMREMETCAQYVLADINVPQNVTQFYLGNETAPEGYVWVFPKGKRAANVGIGISGTKSGPGHRAIDYLNSVVRKHFPEGKPIELIVGGVSVCKPLECTVSDNLMFIGDAARVSDPLTGGGIYNALYTGKLAVDVASKAIANGDTGKKALMEYDRGWRSSALGKALERNHKIKEIFITLSDEKLNSIVRSISKINMKEFDTFTLIKELIRVNPKLSLELGALWASIR